MFGTLSLETEVKVPSSKAWALYGTLELGKVVAGKVMEAVDVVEGDGGTGTILKLTLKPGLGFPYYKEKFMKVDNENMVKETEVVEGGFLDIGFTLYRIRFEIKDKPNDDTASSCVLKISIEYNVKEEFVANASFITNEPLLGIMSVANEHLLKSSEPLDGIEHLLKSSEPLDGNEHLLKSSEPLDENEHLLKSSELLDENRHI